MAIKADLQQLIKPYYWVNTLLSLSYLVAKRLPGVCNLLFPDSDCELDSRETEILFFLIIVVMLRTRKAGSVTMVNYLSSSFIYTKIANLLLWFYADVRMGLAFGVLFVLCGMLIPEPVYQGPENVVYFRGLQDMEEEMARDKRVAWLVCFYAAWHPACANFAPVFSQLSANYNHQLLKFGKLDVGRFPDAAARHRVMDGPTSRQLPSLLLFRSGRETERRPAPDQRSKLIKFVFTADNIKTVFELDALLKESKESKQSAAAPPDKKTQ